MPSLRVLPVGILERYDSIVPAEFRGDKNGGLEWLSPVSFERLNEALSHEKPDLILFFDECRGSTAIRQSIATAGRLASVVLVPTYDEDDATDCIQRGAQDYLGTEGLAPGTFHRALLHAWQRASIRAALFRSIEGSASNHPGPASSVFASRLRELSEERVRAEKALVETVSRYRFLLDIVPQIIWTTDRTGDIIYINRYGTDYTGQPIASAANQGWRVLIHPDDLDHTQRAWERAIPEGVGFEIQHRIRARDGSYRWFDLRAVPRRDEKGNVLEWIGIEADIDEEKRVEARLTEAQDELGIRILERTSELAYANEMLKAEVAERRFAEAEAQRAREIAEAANRSKNEFLANISHEIRTPMNGIIGMTELAMETDLTSQQREYLQLVAHSADSLLVLINDMLDFAKIEAGKLELENEPFLLRKAVQESVDTMAVRAAQKGLALDVLVGDEVPAVVFGDAMRLRQLIINLLGNATKFTEKGRIGVRVTAASDEAGKSEVLFEISDTGIGIPDDKQAVIFEAFAQVDGSMTRRYGGTGLGLAIVSSLVHKMGGEVGVSSKLGEGSTFTLQIPFKVGVASDVPEPATSGQNDATGQGKPPRQQVIVVAEESSETAQALVQMLEGMRRGTTIQGSGKRAAEEILHRREQGRPFHLVMVDATLSDMSGEAFVQLINGEERSFSAPVVLMLPATSTPAEVKSAWSAGPDWVLYKPVMPADLRETLERSAMSDPGNDSDRSPFGGGSPETRAALRVLVAEDNLVNQVVAERILSSFGCSLVTVANGREAVAAVEHEPFDLILMDIQMPEMDGMEATRRIRSLPDERALLPIVAMTAHAMKGDRERFLAAGMDHYISKPFHKDELLLLIKSIKPRVRRAVAMPVSSAPAPAVPDDPEARSSVSLKRFLKTMGGDETLFRGACELFVEWIPGLVMELGKALEEHRADDAGRLAHNLKDSLDSVGARECSERVTVLEANLRSRDFPGALNLFRTIEEENRAILTEMDKFRSSAVAG